MKTVLSTTVMMMLMMVTLIGASLFAEEVTKNPKSMSMRSIDPSPENRLNMALMHEKMAACLRSLKSMDECRDEMSASCQDLGKEGCYMMERGVKRQSKMMPGKTEEKVEPQDVKKKE